MTYLKKFSWSILLKNLFFPVFCAGCGKEGGFLCDVCRTKIEYRENPWLTEKKFEPVAKIFAPLLYERNATAAELIQTFKFQFAFEVSNTLIELAAVPMLRHKEDFRDAVLVPVPLHKKRHRWRGFNQAEMIAAKFGKILELPVVPMLRRARDTPPQAELSAKERQKNVAGAFELITLSDALPERIFLVDDVASTGATLKACAQTIKKHTDIEIDGLVLAAPKSP